MKTKLATMLAAVALLGAVTPATVCGAAQASTPSDSSRSHSTADERLRNSDVGTRIWFTNHSKETVRLQHNHHPHGWVVPPGHNALLLGVEGDCDDISVTAKFEDGKKMPIYGHNPKWSEAYVQVSGHKWYGNGTDTIENRKFGVIWEGTRREEHDEVFKCWAMDYHGVK